MNTIQEYSKKVTVKGYEVSAQGIMRLSVLLRMCQEISQMHLDAVDLPYRKLWDDGLVFLIMTNQIRINKMPIRGDEITLVTRPRGTVGVQFYRDFSFYVNGEEAAYIMQASVSANPQTHKIVRPKVFLAYHIFSGCAVPEEERITRVKVPEEMALWGERPIRYSDLDGNGHVNNSIYADILTDFLPGGANGHCFSNVQINYINESTLDDTLKIYGQKQENGEFLIRGDNAKGVSFSAKMSLVELSEEIKRANMARLG